MEASKYTNRKAGIRGGAASPFTAVIISLVLLSGIVACSSTEKKPAEETGKTADANSGKTGDDADVKKRGGGDPSTADDKQKTGGILGGDKGCISGDCNNGTGVYVYENGDRYTGEFKNGLRDGKGLFDYANKDRFAGEFKEDLKEGEGTYRFQDGTTFLGEFKQGLRVGRGEYRFKDGGIFRGEFNADGESGKGVLTVKGAWRICEIRKWTLWCEAGSGRNMNKKPPMRGLTEEQQKRIEAEKKAAEKKAAEMRKKTLETDPTKKKDGQ